MGKSFRVSRDERPRIEFDITLEDQILTPAVGVQGEDGYVPEVRGEITEKFSATPSVPGALMLDVAASGAAGPEYQASAIRRFLNRVVDPADRERFWKVVDDSDPAVDMKTLNEITQYLMEQYGDRPTG